MLALLNVATIHQGLFTNTCTELCLTQRLQGALQTPLGVLPKTSGRRNELLADVVDHLAEHLVTTRVTVFTGRGTAPGRM